MIQRIQSVYLLCAIIFMAIFAFMPYFTITTVDATYQLTTCGLITVAAQDATTVTTQNYTVAILSALTVILSVIAIFLYKNRRTQILVCKINNLLYIALYVVIALYAYVSYQDLQGAGFATTSYIVFPVCALITNWLAMSAIKKDEQLVRDSERMWSRK